MLEFGETIKWIREERKISQRALAERAAVTPAFLSLMESGKRHPSRTVMKRFAAALRIPEEVLLWDAIQLPADLSNRDKRICQAAKNIARKYLENRHGRLRQNSSSQ